MRKRDGKKGTNPGSGGMRAGPKGYHFKRFPSEENKEESRLKGENKVECKKWSAKGTYRKASADREPTQNVNTLGGQRPRADLIFIKKCLIFEGAKRIQKEATKEQRVPNGTKLSQGSFKN